jgi:hypothetical protein
MSEMNLAKVREETTVEVTVEMTAVVAGSGIIGVAANEFGGQKNFGTRKEDVEVVSHPDSKFR